jgi:protein-arginine deiminase
MFVGKYWSNNVLAEVSINQVLADTDVMNESAWAAVEVASQIKAFKAETGITDQEIVPLPFLHWKNSGYSVAYNPGTVNGTYLSDTVYASPDPWGPVIQSKDIFKNQLSTVLAPYGITVFWIENWDLYHRLLGEVHCGTNATRVIPKTVNWWESGK